MQLSTLQKCHLIQKKHQSKSQLEIPICDLINENVGFAIYLLDFCFTQGDLTRMSCLSFIFAIFIELLAAVIQLTAESTDTHKISLYADDV